MADAGESREFDESFPTLQLRPSESFLQLPLKYRWEATRRHPYYLRFWHLAAADVDPGDQRAVLARDAARVILKAVNVSSCPVDPAVSFEELDRQPASNAFLGGALAPFTLRGCVTLLAQSLEGNALRAVARELLAASNVSRDNPAAWHGAHERIAQLPGLDGIPNDGVVSFNPRAPMQAIVDDLKEHVRAVKERLGVRELRRRFEKLPEYFRAWDAREGWTGSGYDRSCEKKLKQIARNRRLPLRTVSGHYRAAFEIIFGTTYDPDLWVKLVMPLKFAGAGGDASPPRVGRPLRTRTRRPVPESVLSNPRDAFPLLNAAGFSSTEFEFRDLLMDIRHLISVGASNEEICKIMELGPDGAETIEYLREHQDELS